MTAREVAASGNLMRVISTDVESALPLACVMALCSEQLLAQHLIKLSMPPFHLETILKFTFYLTENTYRLHFRDNLFFKCYFTPNSSLDKRNSTHLFDIHVSILVYVSLSLCCDHNFHSMFSWQLCLICKHLRTCKSLMSRSQWSPGLRCGSAVVRLLILWVRIQAGAWLSVCCECSVLSGRGLCGELITRPEEF